MVDMADVNDKLAEHIDEAYIELITFKAQGAPTGYLAVNSEDIVSRGITYTAGDLKYKPRDSSGEQLKKAKIVISNVTRDLIAAIRQAHDNPMITAELIAASRPDDVIKSDGPLELHNVVFTTQSIQAELGQTRVFEERFPTYTYNPGQSPGVFA